MRSLHVAPVDAAAVACHFRSQCRTLSNCLLVVDWDCSGNIGRSLVEYRLHRLSLCEMAVAVVEAVGEVDFGSACWQIVVMLAFVMHVHVMMWSMCCVGTCSPSFLMFVVIFGSSFQQTRRPLSHLWSI